MSYDEFLARVADHAAVDSADAAEAICRAVLRVLSQRLSKLESEALAEDLPFELSRYLRGGVHGEDFSLRDFHSRVAEREGVFLGFAVEHTLVVMRVLSEVLRPEVIQRLQKELPSEIGVLLSRHEPEGRPDVTHVNPEHHTLAEGRPGSSRPLHSARPYAGQDDSVVTSDNPHGDTKLSSSRGLTQEREDETLGAGRPGSSRPIGGGK